VVVALVAVVAEVQFQLPQRHLVAHLSRRLQELPCRSLFAGLHMLFMSLGLRR